MKEFGIDDLMAWCNANNISVSRQTYSGDLMPHFEFLDLEDKDRIGLLMYNYEDVIGHPYSIKERLRLYFNR